MLYCLILVITVIPNIEGADDSCFRRNIAFVIDESGSVTISGFQKQLAFLQNIASSFIVGEQETLVGAVAFSNTARLVFGFRDYVTTTDVIEALGNIDYREGGTAIGLGIDYARENLFTKTNGYPGNGENHMIVITDGNSHDTADAGKRARDIGFILTAVGVAGYNYEDLIQATGNPRRIFLAPDYDALGPLVDNVTNLFLCNEYSNCGNSYFGYSESLSVNDYEVYGKDKGFLMADYKVTCCGVITAWEFVPASPGLLIFQVWRRVTGTKLHTLIAVNSIVVRNSHIGHPKNFSIPLEQQIVVEPDDVIGWYNQGSVIPAYVSISSTTSTTNLQADNFSLANLKIGSTFDWSNGTKLTSTDQFLFRFYTEIDTMSFFTQKTSFLLPDHTPVGHTVTDFAVDNHVTVNNLTLNHTYFRFNGDRDKIIVKSKLKRMYAEYLLVVTSLNACQMTSSVTLTVTTYNLPPQLSNIPASVTIRDDTVSGVKVRDLKIVDGSGDPFCCMLSRTYPSSSNFNLVFNETDGVYSVVTATNPVFSNKEISNFYRLTICCTDGMVTSSSFMDVKVLATSKADIYIPPTWFISAIVVGLIPVSIGLIFVCIFICDTMYFSTDEEEPMKATHKKTKKSKLRGEKQ